MNDIMEIVQALEDSNILLKGVTKPIKYETKEQKRWILKYVIRYSRDQFVSLLGNLLTGKGIARAGYGNHLKKGKGIVRAGYGNHSQNKMDF